MPVRVIRGHQSKTSYVGKVYTFDGLYMVVLLVIFHPNQLILFDLLVKC